MKALPSSTVIFTYKGGSITAKDVENDVGPRLESLRGEILDLYQKRAQQLLNQRLLDGEMRKQKAASLEELFEDKTVNDTTVANYIKNNKIDPTQKDQVRKFLQDQMSQLKRQEVLAKLEKEADVKAVMGSARFDTGSLRNSPSQGEGSAKVVVENFCDFQNPTCARARIVIEELKAKYSKQLRVAYRNFPVDSQKWSKPAALAAICAFKQAKFWEAYDALYNVQATLSDDKIKNVVSALVPDKGNFDKCLQSKEAQESLEKDLDSAKSLDIHSTPTFLVNGAKVTDLDGLREKVAAEMSKK